MIISFTSYASTKCYKIDYIVVSESSMPKGTIVCSVDKSSAWNELVKQYKQEGKNIARRSIEELQTITK